MSNYLIVGGGISALGAASLLEKHKISYQGLEKADHIGGRFAFGTPRFYRQQTASELQEILPNAQILKSEAPPLERAKGEWREITAGLSPSEEYYFHSPFFYVSAGEIAATGFELKKTVVKVIASEKKVVCQDGSEYSYDKLIWTAGLKQLNRLWTDDKTPVLKLISKLEEGCGGIYLDWETNRKMFPTENSILFGFRFRDEKLRAIGRERALDDGKFSAQWILFLESELAEDREEVAKRLRSFRRELEKELPEAAGAVDQERIVFFDTISGESPVKLSSIEALPDIIVLGPDVCLASKEQPDTLHNLDLCLWNVGQFARHLALKSLDTAGRTDTASPPLDSKAIENPAENVIERAGG